MSLAPVAHLGRRLSTRPMARSGARVPWGSVLGFAVPLALADGLVVVVLRVATGSILRTGEPFASWVRESVLLSPLYVVCVLLALAWSQRLLDGSTRGRAATWSLVRIAGSATTAGLVWLTVSVAYDYRLEIDEMRSMPSMIASCSGVCLDRMEAATGVLQLRTLAFGAVLLLVTNVLVVLWCWAGRGGRVVPEEGPARSCPGERAMSRRDDVRLLVTAGLLGAAVVHAAVVPEHLQEWLAAGVFFLVLTTLEVMAAALVMSQRPDRWPSLLIVGLSTGTLVLWGYSRFVGLPLGPEPGAVEPVGVADLAAVVLEMISLVGATVLVVSNPLLQRAASPRTMSTAIAAVVAVTALGLGGSGLGWFHEFGDGHEHGTTVLDNGPATPLN